jgi:hypothetical protein
VKVVEIVRRAGLDRATFECDHLAAGGSPVILTDVVPAWDAYRKWSFDFFASAFGNELVPLSPSLSSSVVKVTKLSAFLSHIQDPQGDLPGFWTELRSGKPAAGPAHQIPSYYLLGWYAFQRHPQLLDDIQPLPVCIEDWEGALEPGLRESIQAVSGCETTSLYVGATGTVSHLHQDFWGTHGWLAQIRGRKKVFLFAPDAGVGVGADAARFDPETPDLSLLAGARDVTAFTATLAPGELLFTPSRWWHWVKGLEATITVSHNFFNRVNAGEHLDQLERRAPVVAAQLSAASMP